MRAVRFVVVVNEDDGNPCLSDQRQTVKDGSNGMLIVDVCSRRQQPDQVV